MRHAALARQQGFNLVEIMVSMVLAVMVFLGLAKGQVVSLQQAHYSLQSTLATIEALLIAGSAFVSIVQTPHAQPVTSAEVDGALMHLSEVVVAD